jgi:hypothetical protein
MSGLRDIKEALGNARKAGFSHVRSALKRYVARACEWGTFRYVRSNYLRPANDAPRDSVEAVRAEFNRHRTYLEAADRHLTGILDKMELHQATDPDLVDIEGMRRAVYAADTDVDPKTGVASGLPHACGLAASINMAITQATTYGLLPEDPGQPWVGALADKEQAIRKVMETPPVTYDDLAGFAARENMIELSPGKPVELDTQVGWFTAEVNAPVAKGDLVTVTITPPPATWRVVRAEEVPSGVFAYYFDANGHAEYAVNFLNDNKNAEYNYPTVRTTHHQWAVTTYRGQ